MTPRKQEGERREDAPLQAYERRLLGGRGQQVALQAVTLHEAI
jgi:hypothetical protein